MKKIKNITAIGLFLTTFGLGAGACVAGADEADDIATAEPRLSAPDTTGQTESSVAQAEAPLKTESLVGGCTQLVRTGTFYYSDPAGSRLVGACTITCAQWVQGTAAPYPGEGATCQGMTTSYTSPYIQSCTGCRF